MNRAVTLLFALVLLAGVCVAQNAGNAPQTPPATQPAPPANPTNPSTEMPPDKPAPPPVKKAEPQASDTIHEPPVNSIASGGLVPAGTEVRAVLDAPLSTADAHVGDRFTATITQPVEGSAGAVAIPAGSKIHGEVARTDTVAANNARAGRRAMLNLRFRDIAYPNGATEPLNATLVSVNQTKPSAHASVEGQMSSGTRATVSGKSEGTNAGSAAGPEFGSEVPGLSIGASAGGGYVAAEPGKDVRLPADTALVLRLDQPLSVPEKAR